MDSRRAEAFSDGVFAVAITLLIFNLLPIGSGALSYPVLGRAWPRYAAYVVSFLTIGIMWMNHHTLFGHGFARGREPARSGSGRFAEGLCLCPPALWVPETLSLPLTWPFLPDNPQLGSPSCARCASWARPK